MSAKGDPVARGRPFAEQTEGPAGGLQSASDKHAHTEKDYCQLGYSHKAISVFQKLELSLKGKNGRKESIQYTVSSPGNTHTQGETELGSSGAHLTPWDLPSLLI